MERSEANLQALFNLVKEEVQRVDKVYPRPYASYHEFYGVLKEEVDELWDEIKNTKPGERALITRECIQIMSVIARAVTQNESMA